MFGRMRIFLDQTGVLSLHWLTDFGIGAVWHDHNDFVSFAESRA
jgi:hypothetical protein